MTVKLCVDWSWMVCSPTGSSDLILILGCMTSNSFENELFQFFFCPPPPPPTATMSITKAYCSVGLFWVPKMLIFKMRLSTKPCETEFYLHESKKILSFIANISFLSLAKSPPRELMCNVVQLCLAAYNILLMRKGNHFFLLLAITLAWKWSIKKQTRWLNVETIIILLNSQNMVICQCLADQLFASAFGWQITIFCLTSSNNCC